VDPYPATRTRFYQAITPAAPDTRGLGPQILEVTGSVTVDSGRGFSLSAMAVGQGQLSYQWFRSGVPLPGQTAPTMVVTAASFSDAGIYRVAITDARGISTATVSVLVR
jgi:hypothetical protein